MSGDHRATNGPMESSITLVNVNIKAVKEERRDVADTFTDGEKPDWPMQTARVK